MIGIWSGQAHRVAVRVYGGGVRPGVDVGVDAHRFSQRNSNQRKPKQRAPAGPAAQPQ